MATANVSSEALNLMMEAFQDCATSLVSLKGEIKGHINECIGKATNIVSELANVEQAAKMRAEACEKIYYACREHQKYDEESGEYRPSCSCEERNKSVADDELYNAKCKREQAERLLNEMMREVDNYEKHCESTMNKITDNYIQQGTDRLMQFQERVVRYETLEFIGIDPGGSPSSVPTLQAPQSRADIYNKGSERLKEKMERRKSMFGNYCPKCKCCPCQCDKIRELFIERSL